MMRVERGLPTQQSEQNEGIIVEILVSCNDVMITEQIPSHLAYFED